jgi:N-acetylglucosamine kinase-like BadF-type ATPase
MSRKFILVESGATKSEWRIVDENGRTVRQALRPGMNVSTMKMEDIKEIISGSFSVEGFAGCGADGFYLYTAGVVTGGIREELSSCVKSVSKIADIDVQDDLMGAARAVCGHEPGIAAILGTGSNACFYDGSAVHRKVYSGGFILGDEGSGARLGKLFLSDYIKGLVPSDVVDDFEREFDASYPAIVEGVYRSSSPSGYLGSMAPFILAHKDSPYICNLIQGNFRDFADRILGKYDTSAYRVGLVGGFAWACRDILLPILEENGIAVSRILKAPVEGLCEYHSLDLNAVN